MPEVERATREGLSQGLSEYYNSPVRLAVFRRKFDSRKGEDPTAFATELEILAVRGFGDIGPQARTRMVRDRFISEQQSCGLRRHLDSVTPDTPIREIVDRCRVWESHTDQNRRPPPGTNVGWKHSAVASVSRESSFYTEDPLMTDTPPGVEPKVPVSVVRETTGGGASVRGEWDRIVSDLSGNEELLPITGDSSGMAGEPGITPEVGNALAQFFSHKGLSPLVARVFCVMLIRLRITRPAMDWWNGLTGHFS